MVPAITARIEMIAPAPGTARTDPLDPATTTTRTEALRSETGARAAPARPSVVPLTAGLAAGGWAVDGPAIPRSVVADLGTPHRAVGVAVREPAAPGMTARAVTAPVVTAPAPSPTAAARVVTAPAVTARAAMTPAATTPAVATDARATRQVAVAGRAAGRRPVTGRTTYPQGEMPRGVMIGAVTRRGAVLRRGAVMAGVQVVTSRHVAIARLVGPTPGVRRVHGSARTVARRPATRHRAAAGTAGHPGTERGPPARRAETPQNARRASGTGGTARTEPLGRARGVTATPVIAPAGIPVFGVRPTGGGREAAAAARAARSPVASAPPRGPTTARPARARVGTGLTAAASAGPIGTERTALLVVMETAAVPDRSDRTGIGRAMIDPIARGRSGTAGRIGTSPARTATGPLGTGPLGTGPLGTGRTATVALIGTEPGRILERSAAAAGTGTGTTGRRRVPEARPPIGRVGVRRSTGGTAKVAPADRGATPRTAGLTGRRPGTVVGRIGAPPSGAAAE